MAKQALIESAALLTAVAVSAGAAAGAVSAARGDVTGAPGISKALARLGGAFGGSMLTGVAVASAGATLVGLAVYQSIRQL